MRFHKKDAVLRLTLGIAMATSGLAAPIALQAQGELPVDVQVAVAAFRAVQDSGAVPADLTLLRAHKLDLEAIRPESRARAEAAHAFARRVLTAVGVPDEDPGHSMPLCEHRAAERTEGEELEPIRLSRCEFRGGKIPVSFAVGEIGDTEATVYISWMSLGEDDTFRRIPISYPGWLIRVIRDPDDRTWVFDSVIEHRIAHAVAPRDSAGSGQLRQQ